MGAFISWISCHLLYTFGDEMQHKFLQPPLLCYFWASNPYFLRINIIKSPLKPTAFPLLFKDCLTVSRLPSPAIGSGMMEVGSIFSIMVVVIVVALLVVEEGVSGNI